ncbi:MAG: Spy/CpxP family protein refolding chaperone [Paludibacter sp.]|nr:Spy/CpxP family protein refolding chaperone [Paludibacter sp.]
MKKQILLMLVAIIAMNLTALAQTPQREGGKQPMNAKSRAEQMAKDLSLTDAQKQEVQALFEEQQTKLKEMKEAGGTNEDAHKEELKKLRKDWDNRLGSIIGQEKLEKHKAMMKERGKEVQSKRPKQVQN